MFEEVALPLDLAYVACGILDGFWNGILSSGYSWLPTRLRIRGSKYSPDASADYLFPPA